MHAHASGRCILSGHKGTIVQPKLQGLRHVHFATIFLRWGLSVALSRHGTINMVSACCLVSFESLSRLSRTSESALTKAACSRTRNHKETSHGCTKPQLGSCTSSRSARLTCHDSRQDERATGSCVGQAFEAAASMELHIIGAARRRWCSWPASGLPEIGERAQASSATRFVACISSSQGSSFKTHASSSKRSASRRNLFPQADTQLLLASERHRQSIKLRLLQDKHKAPKQPRLNGCVVLCRPDRDARHLCSKQQ